MWVLSKQFITHRFQFQLCCVSIDYLVSRFENVFENLNPFFTHPVYIGYLATFDEFDQALCRNVMDVKNIAGKGSTEDIALEEMKEGEVYFF